MRIVKHVFWWIALAVLLLFCFFSTNFALHTNDGLGAKFNNYFSQLMEAEESVPDAATAPPQPPLHLQKEFLVHNGIVKTGIRLMAISWGATVAFLGITLYTQYRRKAAASFEEAPRAYPGL